MSNKPDKKKIIIIAVAACVVIAGIIFGVLFSNRNVKDPGKKNDDLIDKAPENIAILSDKEKTTEADVTAITAGTDKDGKVVDSKGIVDISGHKIYDTGEKNKSGETIYTTGKKASNGQIFYTLNKADSFGNQIYYTGTYVDGKLQLTNTAETPDYTTNDTPKKNNTNVTTTTTTTVGYKNISNITITGTKADYYRYFGGTGVDSFRSVCGCKDGGFAAICLSESYNGDFEGTSKDWSIHSAIVKYDASGKLVWKYVAGGNGLLSLEDIAELEDGTLVAVGSTAATDTSAPLNSELTSSIVIRMDKNGKCMWSYSFPGDKEQSGDFADCVAATPDGGFVVGGKAATTGGFFSGENANSAYIFKFDKNCNIKWRRTLSGSKSNTFDGVSVAENGDIYATCVTTSTDGDFAALIKGKGTAKNTVLVKLDKNGKLEWSKNLDGSGNSEFKSVCATEDGGCVVAGSYTISKKADGIYSHSYGKSDCYIIRYDSKGNVCWAKSFGGSQNDHAFDVTEIKGGFVIAGNTQSVDLSFTGCGNNGEQDAFLIYLNESGELSYVETYGGKGADQFATVCTLADGSIAAAGTTKSIDGIFKDSGASGQFKAFAAKFTAATKDASVKN